MALITARNLKIGPVENLQPSFTPIEKTSSGITPEKSYKMKPIKIVCGPNGCGCYDYNTGTCDAC